MNSTVSHEMRNPLNAIVSHSERQEQKMDLLLDTLKIGELSLEIRNTVEEILNDLKRSQRITKSSTNLIRFNVEDILALP